MSSYIPSTSRIYAQKSVLDDHIFLPFALYTGCVLVIGYWRFSYI